MVAPVLRSDLGTLDEEEQRTVLSTMLLAQLLDGDVSAEEFQLWAK